MRGRLLFTSVALAGSIAGCSTPQPSSRDVQPPASAAAAATQTAPQKLDLKYGKPFVGADVHATATGLPPGTPVELTWSTVKGGWVIEGYYHFRGKKYEESTASLGRFATDAEGRLDARFLIPEDWGGVHDVIATIDGKPVAQNGIEVTQSFEMTPTSGPVGTPIELRVKGLGWRTMESTWVANWDNNAIGWISAAGTRGTAVARFRAAGPAGDHVIKVYTGWQGQGYLNYEQSPVAHLPRPELMFRTTPGPAVGLPAFAEPYQPQPVPAIEVHVANASIALTPTQGSVGTRAVLRGKGLPAGATLQLFYWTWIVF
mgnify:FL=1